MKDYVQYCPVALASSVIAERWTPLIVRELVLGGRRFNEMTAGCPASPVRCSSSGWTISNAKAS